MKTKIALLLATLSAAALGQGMNGYVFSAPGIVTAGSQAVGNIHIGAGVEGAIGKGIGAGLELGAMSGTRCFPECVVGVFSPNINYHFLRGNERRADPFVTAGYTLMFRHGHANMFNFGGGMNYWVARRVGFRVELRNHVHVYNGSWFHYLGVRFGLAFR
ncbi:MAG TPA: hypothetical protein PLA43_09010 [Bryobacteraceae bacterium]|nr:hypothetical protein [Bryobacteraceae bacterium]HOQ44906.1 hypothetical protein [Bryobacteraceae bacterium]HPQ17327.1 hypothetical protein [Bryobacteraceae bacterium]HPU72084.1 hypothetical protein [Bryobacteraceae bacterium]